MRPHLVAALVAAALMAATWPKVGAAGDCDRHACRERVAAKQCSQHRVVPCIRRAALRWDVSFAMLLRKARCESELDPFAVGFGVHYGIFQFLGSTFASTPYRGRWIFSAKYNSLAAGWMHSAGVNRGGEWACR